MDRDELCGGIRRYIVLSDIASPRLPHISPEFSPQHRVLELTTFNNSLIAPSMRVNVFVWYASRLQRDTISMIPLKHHSISPT